MTTRQQRVDFINSLGLTTNQRMKIMNTNMNINTIRKLLNKVRGKQNRNVLLNGLINRYKSNKNEFYKLVNTPKQPTTPQATPQQVITPRAKRVGAGLSPRKMIPPEVLYEFYLLVSEYRDKKSYLG